ncbi:unnamed protein product [Orchesella dallaii]|uniref:F-box domain-containing protein n=1 Tax=Orchesella dallaii TaxID=48710 RepID=A0ABP1Q603_9HEXA
MSHRLPRGHLRGQRYDYGSRNLHQHFESDPPKHEKSLTYHSLLRQVVPLLIKNNCLKFQELMNCRQTSYHLKNAVDKELSASPKKYQWWKPEWPYPYKFSNSQTVSRFLHNFNTSNSNPFIEKRVELEIHYPKAFPAILKLLANYGHLVDVAKVDLGSCSVRRQAEELPQILTYLSKIQSLDMSMTAIWNGDNSLDERWEEPIDYYSMRGLKDWFFKGPLQQSYFPSCPHLTELLMPYPADNLTVEQIAFQAPFFKSLFKSYGSQLTRLECTYYTFCDIIGEEIFTSIKPSTLKRLRILHWPDQSCVVPREGFETIKYPFYYRFTLEMGKILDHFRNSLEELAFEFLHEQTIDDTFNQFDTTVAYPNLKLLTVYLTNLLSPMWEIFREQYVNLEVIRFEVDWLMWGRDITTGPYELRRFFKIFPSLKSISLTWPPWFKRKDIVFRRSDVMQKMV